MNVERIRQDFPVLSKSYDDKPLIYFDNACMTLKPRQVLDAMDRYYRNYSSCGGRSVHKLGAEVAMQCQHVRERFKEFLNAHEPEEMIFTKNTTEGLNLVANGLALERGDIVMTTDREHNSNLVPWQILTVTRGIKHVIVRSNEDNTFDTERFEEMMSDRVKLVSMVHTSNLEGYTIPAREIAKIAHDYGALVMLDGAQSAAHKPVDVRALDVDFFAFSVHKMMGPTGMGVLYGERELLEKLEPLIVGGGTVQTTSYSAHQFLDVPEKFEAGLQNYAGIIGAGAAIDYLDAIGKENIAVHERRLNERITAALSDIPELVFIGPRAASLRGGIFSFNINGFASHDVAMILDERANILVRSGMQCVDAWFNAHNINGSVRASLYVYNTIEEADTFVENVKTIVKAV